MSRFSDPVKKEVIISSFLFATTKNDLELKSIERCGAETIVLYYNSPYPMIYSMTNDQHEDFLEQMSKKIECIVVKSNRGENQ